MTIHTLLLQPHKGDPLGLCTEGPCRSRPPVMFNRLHHGPVKLSDPLLCDPDYDGCAQCAKPWPCVNVGVSHGWALPHGPWPPPADRPLALVLCHDGEVLHAGLASLLATGCDLTAMLLSPVRDWHTLPILIAHGTPVRLDAAGRVVKK